MKTIIIKHLHLLNFKGVANLTIDFDAHATDIAGRNGTGKTTVFDAFTWLLFGKDSMNRTEFDLKTLDADGKIIYHLPHEVSAIINVDGEDITLCRRLVEKWPKRNGEPTFTGNQVERLFNDVPCNEKEFTAKIAEICDEDTFKKITSPTFFVSQKSDKQKSDLMRMAGEINDADIAAGNPEFEMLLGMLGTGSTKKSIDELKREIGAKKSRVKSEIADKPGRIDEKKRDIARDTDDFPAIESEIATLTAERADIYAQLTDINAAAEKIERRRIELASALSNLKIKLSRRRDEITENALAGVRDRERELKRIDAELDTEQRNIARLTGQIERDRAVIEDLTARRKRMLTEYNSFNSRIDAINAETLTFDDADFVCPTCHRALELDDIASKQTEMTERFNAEKQRRVKSIETERDANLAAGKRVRAEIDETTARIESTTAEIAELNKRVNALHAERTAKNDITRPDVEPIIAADAEIIRIKGEIADIEAKIAEPVTDSTSCRDELKKSCIDLDNRLNALKTRLAKRDAIVGYNDRIAVLESEYRSLNDELTELEHLEYIITEFSKAKSETIDARINGLFDIVRFRWIKYRINGEEQETCEATINGVPYASLNAAGRIAAGIDIINAICKFEGVTAPMFLDNAESVNVIPDTLSQQIRLIVSTDDRITVKPSNSLTA